MLSRITQLFSDFDGQGRWLDAPLLDVLARAEVHGPELEHLAALLDATTMSELIHDDRLMQTVAGAFGDEDRATLCRELIALWVWSQEPPARKGAKSRKRATEGRPQPFEGSKPGARAKPIAAWVETYQLQDALETPARAVLPFVSSWMVKPIRERIGEQTLGQLLEDPPKQHRELGHFYRELLSAAAALLGRAVQQRELEAWRRRAWSKPPTHASLRELAGLCRRYIDGIAAEPLMAPGHLEIGADPPRFALRADGLSVALRLANWESGELRFETNTAMPELEEGLQRWLLEELMDVIHDPDDSEHERLKELVAAPMWSRLVRHVEHVAEAREGAAPQEKTRIAWRIDLADFSIHPVEQKLAKRGWTQGRKRSPRWVLHTVDGAVPTTADKYIAMELGGHERWGGADHPPEATLDRVVSELAKHPIVFVNKSTPVQIRQVPLTLALRQVGDGYVARIRFDGQLLAVDDVYPMALREVLYRHDAEAGVLAVRVLSHGESELLDILRDYSLRIPKEALDRLLGAVASALPSLAVEVPSSFGGKTVVADGRLVARVYPQPGQGALVAVGVRPTPVANLVAPGSGPGSMVALEGGKPTAYLRDLRGELAAADGLAEHLGLGGSVGPERPHFVRSDEDLLELLEKVQGLATVEWPEDEIARRVVGTIDDLKLEITPVEHWLGVDGSARVGKHRVRLKDLLRVRHERRRFVALGNGRFARITDELRDRIDRAADALYEQDKGIAAATASAAELLALIQDARAVEGRKVLEAAVAKMERAQALNPKVPPALQATLRDYQEDGYRWLGRLAGWGLGGILADDMGLGKTLQALALCVARGGDGPALVVAPTSVVDNWKAETERFAPSLQPVVYRGKGRTGRLAKLGPHTVILSSYDVVYRDIESLREHEFRTLVLDEAQAIKNPASKRAAAVHQLRAEFRVALTGTPIENRISELWSIFHAVHPGLLGPWAHFREVYGKRIVRDGDPRALERLRKRIGPFVLRRTKEQVARELPPKTEVVHRLELSRPERAIYDAARHDAIRKLEKVRAGDAKARIEVLAELTKLRQLACHPRLLDAQSAVESTKLEHALEICRELISSGHRSLIFSQFTRHLGLLRERLDAEDIPYLYLDGRTPAAARKKRIDRFQAGDVAFFLISLKAGGTGLNLTAADYVIHLDPWWNPAVEDQASDRTHRIGQTKPITVVRLVSQGTIEETVYELHAKKRKLAEDLLAGADASAPVSTRDLVDLLRAE
ncbi:MAG: DEAD/DEAH box helicase [Myxococcota bacterium]